MNEPTKGGARLYNRASFVYIANQSDDDAKRRFMFNPQAREPVRIGLFDLRFQRNDCVLEIKPARRLILGHPIGRCVGGGGRFESWPALRSGRFWSWPRLRSTDTRRHRKRAASGKTA